MKEKCCSNCAYLIIIDKYHEYQCSFHELTDGEVMFPDEQGCPDGYLSIRSKQRSDKLEKIGII